MEHRYTPPPVPHSNVWHTYTETGRYQPKVTVFSPENVMLAEDAISLIMEKTDERTWPLFTAIPIKMHIVAR